MFSRFFKKNSNKLNPKIALIKYAPESPKKLLFKKLNIKTHLPRCVFCLQFAQKLF